MVGAQVTAPVLLEGLHHPLALRAPAVEHGLRSALVTATVPLDAVVQGAPAQAALVAATVLRQPGLFRRGLAGRGWGAQAQVSDALLGAEQGIVAVHGAAERRPPSCGSDRSGELAAVFELALGVKPHLRQDGLADVDLVVVGGVERADDRVGQLLGRASDDG